MSVWFAVPVAAPCIREANATFARWKTMGYSTACLLDQPARKTVNADMVIETTEYKGWGWASNMLLNLIFNTTTTTWAICGGHDIWPESFIPPETLEQQLDAHFNGGMGVMQPRGDCFGALVRKSACVSPWINRAWWRQTYAGKGPFWEGYHHFYTDKELCVLAAREKCLWWRDDVTQYHNHYLRRGSKFPDHLAKANERAAADKLLFEAREAAGFPGAR